nr:small heat shock protein [Ailoscolex lacteospumosus]
MGSLMRDQRWFIMDKSSPPSPLTPFHQRQNNRSPLESPPIAKKLPKVRDGNLFFGQMFVDLSTTSSSPVFQDASEGKENRSILKRTGVKSRTLRAAGRRVDFDQDVVVNHFDRVEGGHVSRESQRLSSSDSKDRKEFVNRTLQGRNRPITPDSHSPRISPFGSREPPIQYAVPLPAVTTQYDEPFPVTSSQYDGGRLPFDQSSFKASLTLERRVQPPAAVQERPDDDGVMGVASEVDFAFFEDEQHRLRLKFTIALGDGVAANDVLVKANTNGNKVRLVGTRTIGTSRQGTVIRQEFTQRYQLPMEVDPYMITARMDNSGNLYVEAPVMTSDRRRALALERQTISDARIGAISSDFVL